MITIIKLMIILILNSDKIITNCMCDFPSINGLDPAKMRERSLFYFHNTLFMRKHRT